MSNDKTLISYSSFHAKVCSPWQRRSCYPRVLVQASEEVTCPRVLAKQQPNKDMTKPWRPGFRVPVSQFCLTNYLFNERLQNEEPFHFFLLPKTTATTLRHICEL